MCCASLPETVTENFAAQRDSRLLCSEGFVNKADNYADDGPLDEVNHGLCQSEFQPDVQVHVVMQHKSANHENANQDAQTRTFRSTRSPLMDHRENNRDHQDRYQRCGHSNGHHGHDFSFDRNTSGYLRDSSIRAGTSQTIKKPKAKYTTVPPS